MASSGIPTSLARRSVLDAIVLLEGRVRRIELDEKVGPSGLGHGPSIRKLYFRTILRFVRAVGWDLVAWPDASLRSAATWRVRDLVDLVLHTAVPLTTRVRGAYPSPNELPILVRKKPARPQTPPGIMGSGGGSLRRGPGVARTGSAGTLFYKKGIVTRGRFDRGTGRDVGRSYTTDAAGPRRPPEAPVERKPAPAKSSPKAKPSFFFALRGKNARANSIVVGSAATLVFDYDVPPSDAIALVRGKALAAAKAANLDITLILTPGGAVRTTGSQIGIAKFAAGRLLASVEFSLEAAAEEGHGSLHVQFSVKGETVHETRIPLKVVKELPATSRPVKVEGPLLSSFKELAKRTYTPPARRIDLHLSMIGGQLRMTVSDSREGEPGPRLEFQSIRLDRVYLNGLLTRVQKALDHCYQLERVWEVYDGESASGRSPAQLKLALDQAVEAVAVAGSLLDEGLRVDPEIDKALKYLEESFPDGAVLNVSTDEVFLPWELMYPSGRSENMSDEERASNPVRKNAFWGVRFAIETEKRAVGPVWQLRDLHVGKKPKVSINLNPEITLPGASAEQQPGAVQKAWAARLKKKGYLGNVEDRGVQVRAMLREATTDASFVYLYCHGRSTDFFGGLDETLVLDADVRMSPRDLKGDTQFSAAPIIFLSSCMGAVSSPLVYSSFLSEFRRRGALGMIGTTYSVPIAFAAHFGQQVVDSYLNRGGSLAVEMLKLRRRHLLDLGNPVPLFYTLQCHLDALAR